MSDSIHNFLLPQGPYTLFQTRADATAGLSELVPGILVYIISENTFYYWVDNITQWVPLANAIGGGSGPTVSSGIYTPILTNIANLTSSTAYVCQYLQVGNVITVSGQVNITPTVSVRSTQLGISLPIASAFVMTGQCGGSAYSQNIAAQGASIIGNVSTGTATMEWQSLDITSQSMSFSFTYLIV